jgi:hypothetical protein
VHPLVGFALAHPEQAPLHHLKRRGFEVGQDKQQPVFGGRQMAVLIHREPAGSPRFASHLPSPFWRKANNFRGLFEFLPLYVATIKFAYIEIFSCFYPLYILLW